MFSLNYALLFLWKEDGSFTISLGVYCTKAMVKSVTKETTLHGYSSKLSSEDQNTDPNYDIEKTLSLKSINEIEITDLIPSRETEKIYDSRDSENDLIFNESNYERRKKVVSSTLNASSFATWREIIIILLITALLNADQLLLAPHMSQVAEDFNLDEEEKNTLIGGLIPFVIEVEGVFGY